MSASTIPKRFIGAIDDNNIGAGANIATSKLADGANFIKKDGSVTMTGSLNAGNQEITNVGTPSAGTSAATKAYVDTLYNNFPQLFKNKGTAKAAATGNITVSNPGTAVFDGITLSNGDILLLPSQTAPAENGIYTFNGSASALTRIATMDSWIEVPGATVIVEQGTTLADKFYFCTSDQGGTLGTTAINWQLINGSGLTSSNFVTGEVLSGTINGVNTAFTLANTPTAGSEAIYNGPARLKSGAGNDYTISGNAVTMLTAPLTGEVLTADYRK